MDGRIGCAPANGCLAARTRRWGTVAHDPRERVTIDLRGLGAAVQLRAAIERTTVASLARRAIAVMLDASAPQAELFSAVAAAAPRVPSDGLPVKVTVRMSATHAMTLATRAHSADVSQGAYVAGLLDKAPPPPQPPDHRAAIDALLSSTDQLAVLSADLNAFMRLLGCGNPAALEPYRASVMSLNRDVLGHLAAASRLMSELKPLRVKPCGLLPGKQEGAPR